MSGTNHSIPSSDFQHPPLVAPPPGMMNDEIDFSEELRRNANFSNEGGGKIQDLLQYLKGFEENQITDLLGYKHLVLSRRNGGLDDAIIGGCLKPLFRLSNENKVKVYFASSFILFPGGDTKSLIPLSPKFQGQYLDNPPGGRPDPSDNHMLLSDGKWRAYIRISGYEANIYVESPDDIVTPNGGTVGDEVVWQIATWEVANSGTQQVRIFNKEFYTCPFLPVADDGAHPFFPHFYQKRNSLQSDVPGSHSWFMKVHYGNINDLETGTQIRVDGCDATTEYSVTAGETWWVRLETSDDGAPSSATLNRGEPSQQSYREEGDDPEGSTLSAQQGIYKFKLFEIGSVNGRLVARVFWGSDIPWTRNLMGNVGEGEGRVWKAFNLENKRHELRSLTGEGDVTVTTMGDEIIIECNCCSCTPYP